MRARSETGGNARSKNGQDHAQRWCRALSGVLVLLAGLIATGAEAQTVAALASNAGLQQNSGASRVVEAQSFTTALHGTGYALPSVRLRPFLDFTGDTGTHVAIKTDSARRPGTLVAALETPDDAYVPGDFFACTAPAGTALQANTACWIVLNEEQAATDWQAWGKTTSSGEDSASLQGRSIGNSRLQRSGTSWNTASGDLVQFDVRGHGNADPKLSIVDASTIEGNAVRFAVSLDNPADDGGDPLESRSFKLHYGYGFPAFGGRFTSPPEFDIGLSSGQREYGLGLVKRVASELGFALKAARIEAANDSAGAEPKHTTGFHIEARW